MPSSDINVDDLMRNIREEVRRRRVQAAEHAGQVDRMGTAPVGMDSTVDKALATAQTVQGIGLTLPPMLRQHGIKRKLAVVVARIILRSAEIITRDQRTFNYASFTALRSLHENLKVEAARTAELERRTREAEQALDALRTEGAPWTAEIGGQAQAMKQVLETIRAEAAVQTAELQGRVRAMEQGLEIIRAETAARTDALADRSRVSAQTLATRPLTMTIPRAPDVHYNEVLRSEEEIARAVSLLGWEHPVRPKTWDLFKALHYLLQFVPARDSRVLDAGCEASPLLECLYGQGYRSLYGCDLTANRLPDVPSFIFFKGDLTRMPYPDGYFKAVTCISVIEHGVAIEACLREMARLLEPGGHLLISTDYHEPKVSTDEVDRTTTFGVPWTIFCRQDIEALVAVAHRYGFTLLQPLRWDIDMPPVRWGGKLYTFIFLAFRLTGAERAN